MEDLNRQRLQNQLIFMIEKDNLLLSTVEKQGFLTFMKCVAPLYSLPSQKKITKLIEEKYLFLFNFVRTQLSETKYIALTTDIWTDTLNTKSYIGVTAHYHNNCV